MISSSYNNISNNRIENNGGYGIYLIPEFANSYSKYNSIYNNVIANVSYGIVFDGICDNNDIILNNISNCQYTGIETFDSDNNRILKNKVNSCGSGIVLLYKSYNYIISYNNIENCGADGIGLRGGLNHIVTNNSMINNYYGLYIRSSYCIIANNTCKYNEENNICCEGSYNLIYHNNFVSAWWTWENGVDLGSYNKWNLSYNLGGNYWSDYSGVDIYNGPGQNFSGGDGFGDTPYDVQNNVKFDYYPLMNKWDLISPNINNVNNTPEIQNQFGFVNITCEVIDNIEVTSVILNITDPNGNISETIMNNIHQTKFYYYNTSYSTLGFYQYYIYAIDNQNNSIYSDDYGFFISTPITFVLVDDDFNISTPGWQYDHFDIIQDGIDRVAVNGTVYVHNGVYNENLVISKPLTVGFQIEVGH